MFKVTRKHDKTFEEFANQIKLNLLAHSGISKNISRALNANISVNSSFNVNASSSISVNLGMLNFLENEDELAAILGHEISHRLLNKADLFDTNALFEKENWGIEKEQEADCMGSYLLARAQYNPLALVDILTRLSQHPDYVAKPTSNDTHPPLEKRIDSLQNYIIEKSWERKQPIKVNYYRHLV